MKKNDDMRGMTSRGRKELRRREEGAAEMTEAEYAEKRGRARVFLIAGLIVAVMLIAAGITIPTVMAANYMFYDNPVAVFTFGTGGEKYEVEYEIFVSDAPNAANNFMYLASIGYFDGTIVFDTQNEQVRFGGYYDPVYDEEDGEWDYSHRSKDLGFISGLTDDFSPERFENESYPEVFRYTVKKDYANKMKYSDFDYALCGNYSGSALSATEFQFCCDRTADAEHLSPQGGSGSVQSLSLEVFGAPLDEEEAAETFGVILGLDRYVSSDGTPECARRYFRAPMRKVTVERVKIYNYSPEWKDSKYKYGFESYMTEINALTTGWSKSYL